jgi:hypothetical protein
VTVTFTDGDLAAMAEYGRIKLANAEALGTRHVNRFREDRIGGYVDGKATAGYTLEIDGLTLDVRYTHHRTGRVMCPANKRLRADVVVLVIAGSTDNEVEIVGGIATDTFYEIAKRRDFGYGDTYYVDQRQLMPWSELREALL